MSLQEQEYKHRNAVECLIFVPSSRSCAYLHALIVVPQIMAAFLVCECDAHTAMDTNEITVNGYKCNYNNTMSSANVNIVSIVSIPIRYSSLFHYLNNMAINIRNVLTILNERFGHIEESQRSAEEEHIAQTIIDILEGAQNYFEVDECLEFDGGTYTISLLQFDLNLSLFHYLNSNRQPEYT